jgi:hypothetical protein
VSGESRDGVVCGKAREARWGVRSLKGKAVTHRHMQPLQTRMILDSDGTYSPGIRTALAPPCEGFGG